MDKNNEYLTILFPKEKKEIKLDIKDLRILDAIITNARTTLTTLSRITNLSKISVINRINRLEKLELITGYTLFIDFLKLGLDVYNIGIKVNMSLDEKTKYVEYLKNINNITNIVTFSGHGWDLLIRVIIKNNDHLNKFISQITKDFGIINMDILKLIEVDYELLDLFDLKQEIKLKKGDFSFRKTFLSSKINKIKFDDKDVEILHLLSKNSRIQLTKIAEEVKLSTDAISYRIKSLIKQKIIIGFFSNYNLYLLGFNAYVLKLKIFNRDKEKTIIKFLARYGRCTGIMRHLEDWNLIAVFLFKDTLELRKFENELLKNFEKDINEYEILQLQEQPYYNLFPKEIKDFLIGKLS